MSSLQACSLMESQSRVIKHHVSHQTGPDCGELTFLNGLLIGQIKTSSD